MSMSRRLIKNGALFAESIGDLNRLVKMGATVNGAPNIVASPFGPALHFNGSPDFLQIPIPEALKDGTSPWTVLVWAAPDSNDPAANAAIFSTRVDSTHLAVLWHNVSGAPSPAQHDFRMANGGIRRRSSTIPVSAGRYDLIGISLGTALGSGELVVNGISQGIVTDLGVFDCWPTDFTLGWHNGGGYWAGKIAMVAIFPRQLSEAEQLSIYKHRAFAYKYNLVSHWRMDAVDPLDMGWKGSGFDLLGTGLDSTNLVNGIAGGRALSLNGSDEHLKLNVATWQSSDSKGTICAWIKRAATGALHTIFSSSDEATDIRYTFFHIRAGDVLAIQNNDGGSSNNRVVGATTLVAGRWYHVAVVSTGTEYKLFVDGVAEALTVEIGSNNGDWLASVPNRDNIAIGIHFDNSPGLHFDGAIDEVQYYDAPLNNLQIRDIFEMQKQGKI